MKILIVNGFRNTLKSFAFFKEFENAIKDVSVTKGLMLCVDDYKNLNFIKKDIEDLNDYLYYPELGFENFESVCNFEALDLIFIAIEAHIRPWETKSKQALALISMIKKTNKPCFMQGMGPAFLAYILATEPIWNLNRESNIVNRSGSPLKNTEQVIVDSFTGYKNKDWLIDNITGDIYETNLVIYN